MRHLKKTSVIVAALLLLTATMASAQQFKASHLNKAATKLKLDAAALATDSLPATKQVKVGQQTVTLRKDEKGVVEHIGIPLFFEEMRQLQPSPIYDYLEYAVLDHQYRVSDNSLMLQDLKFEKGNWATLSKVMENADGCDIENVSEKYYRVKWTKGGTPVVVVSFPINYELLSNSNRKEMELNFIRDIKTYNDTQRTTPKDYSGRMAPTGEPDMYVVTGSSYIISDINNNRYLTTITEETDSGKTHRLAILFDRHSPKESLANLLVEYDMPIDSAMIELEFVLDNHKRETFTTTIRNWLGFCQKQGLQPFFGFEENKNGTLTGTLIMRNMQSGYDHILAIRAAENELFADHPLVHGKVHLFTPSSNVRSIFDNNGAASRRTKKQ